MDNIQRHNSCPMRTNLGNCDPIGGFCTSINESICEAFQKLYRKGRKNGRWIHKSLESTTDIPLDEIECSECGKMQFTKFEMNFCPNCGADMRGEQT